MNGPGHYALGATAGVVYAQLAPITWWQGILAVPITAGFSYAAVSPDIDLSKLWHLLDRVVPDEWLGNGGPLQHRGITHWWAIYAVLTVLWWQEVPRGMWFGCLFAAVGAVLAGWWSHLLGDLALGARGQGRGPGIPLLPWWAHVGSGVKCGGWPDRIVSGTAAIGVIAWTCSNAWHALPDTHEILAGIGL